MEIMAKQRKGLEDKFKSSNMGRIRDILWNSS